MRCIISSIVETILINKDKILEIFLDLVSFHKVKGAAGPRRELLELHDITSQSAGLVAENILNLSQLLIDVSGLGFAGKVLITIIHVDVEAHERSLPELNNFERHDERNRNKVREDENPGARSLDK